MKANLLRAVRSALARTPGSLSDHPDANLLAAFAEKTLAARERAAVAGHLADCADCREFLALAFGAERAEPAVVVEPRPVRRWSPVWSWAASTAAVCIVVSAVWEFRAQRVMPAEPPPGPPAIRAFQPPRAAPVATAKALPTRHFTPPPGAAPAGTPNQPEAPPPPPAPPPAPQTADAISAAPQPAHVAQYTEQAKVAPVAQDFAQAESVPAAPQSPAPARSDAAARTKTAGAFGMARQPALVRGGVGSAPAVVWTISGGPRGVVQRSNDGGVRWTTVAIDDRVSFRAVAHFGPDVWAGGSAGALFHSVDSGAHWELVSIHATGDVIAIDDAGRGEVQVTTDTHERWLTLDSGRTWRLIQDTPR